MTDQGVRVVTCGGGAAWEAPLVHGLQRRELGVEIVRRCVDHGELVGVALRDRPRAAIIAAELPWLDRELVGTLHDAGVAVMAVESVVGLRPLQRLGIQHRLDQTASAEQVTALLRTLGGRVESIPAGSTGAAAGGRLVVIWGTAGAPGRSVVAWHLAEEAARRGTATVLIDGDGWAACLAQLTGVPEGPALTNAAHLAAGGWPAPITTCLHTTPSGLRVLPGLPRADLWSEIRERSWRAVLDAARETADLVIVDIAHPIDEDEELSFDRAPYRRNLLSRVALEESDDVVIVAAADPIGVRRLVFAHQSLVDMSASASERAALILNRAPDSARQRREIEVELERWSGLRPAAVLPVDPALARAAWDGRPVHDVAPRSAWLRALRAIPQLAARR